MLSKASYLIGFLLFHFLNKNIVVVLDKKLNLKMIISYRKVKSPIYIYFSSPVHRYILKKNLWSPLVLFYLVMGPNSGFIHMLLKKTPF